MPILHSAYKSIKVIKKKTGRNQAIKTHLKTEVKKFNALIASKNIEEAKKQLQAVTRELDKARSNGIITKNTASRKKSRLAKKLQAAVK